jgi:hypothetical protein
MKTEMMECIQCGKPLKGRIDKKFCNDFCRNQHHNQQKAPYNNLVRRISNQLLKNRRILQKLFQNTPAPHTVDLETLLMEGYVFRYHTHSDNKRHICFDMALEIMHDSVFKVVKQNSRSEWSIDSIMLNEQQLNGYGPPGEKI